MIVKNEDVLMLVQKICAIYGQPDMSGELEKQLRFGSKDFILLMGDSGSAMLRAKDCYIKGTIENDAFKDFKTQDNVAMFMIEATGGDRITGSVAQVEYGQFYKLICENEQPLEKIVLLMNGESRIYDARDVKLTDLARFDVINNISSNDSGILATIDYINGLCNAQFSNVDEKVFLSSLESYSKKITVVIIKPNRQPYVDQIVGDIRSLQREVDGLIRAIHHAIDDKSVIICNDSDKRYSYLPNRSINGEVIHGTIVITGFDKDTGEFKSLTMEQQKQYVEKYYDRNRSDHSTDIPR